VLASRTPLTGLETSGVRYASFTLAELVFDTATGSTLQYDRHNMQCRTGEQIVDFIPILDDSVRMSVENRLRIIRMGRVLYRETGTAQEKERTGLLSRSSDGEIDLSINRSAPKGP
jgi:nitrate reductase alpha subunit